MKHEKEWHTCDRCGVEITFKPKTKIKFQRWDAYSDFIPVFEEDELLGKLVYTKYLKQSYELCSKCRKEFERFMRYE